MTAQPEMSGYSSGYQAQPPSSVHTDLNNLAMVNWSHHYANRSDLKALMKGLHFVPNPNSIRTEHRVGLVEAQTKAS
ncbi:MAG: hypothetical protein KC475_03615 [Cyanobacteria bacterium HKST-UBA03]|nr:hypothetical protein [Cyanobacteria bacterium HKST-UBA03]